MPITFENMIENGKFTDVGNKWSNSGGTGDNGERVEFASGGSGDYLWTRTNVGHYGVRVKNSITPIKDKVYAKVYQDVNLTAGRTYVFSAHGALSNETYSGHKAYLAVEPLDGRTLNIIDSDTDEETRFAYSTYSTERRSIIFKANHTGLYRFCLYDRKVGILASSHSVFTDVVLLDLTKYFGLGGEPNSIINLKAYLLDIWSYSRAWNDENSLSINYNGARLVDSGVKGKIGIECSLIQNWRFVHSIIVRYERTNPPSSSYETISMGISGGTRTIENLTTGHEYKVTVTYYSHSGVYGSAGETQTLAWTQLPAKLEAPELVKATPELVESGGKYYPGIKLYWNSHNNLNSKEITRYSIVDDGKTILTEEITSGHLPEYVTTIINMQEKYGDEGYGYTSNWKISVTNLRGTAQSSNFETPTSFKKPPKIENTALALVQRNPTNGTPWGINFTWTKPYIDADTPTPIYEITVIRNSDTPKKFQLDNLDLESWHHASNNATLGLTLDSSYRYYIKAINILGEGPASDEKTITGYSTPGTLIDPRATSTIVNGESVKAIKATVTVNNVKASHIMKLIIFQKNVGGDVTEFIFDENALGTEGTFSGNKYTLEYYDTEVESDTNYEYKASILHAAYSESEVPYTTTNYTEVLSPQAPVVMAPFNLKPVVSGPKENRKVGISFNWHYADTNIPNVSYQISRAKADGAIWSSFTTIASLNSTEVYFEGRAPNVYEDFGTGSLEEGALYKYKLVATNVAGSHGKNLESNSAQTYSRPSTVRDLQLNLVKNVPILSWVKPERSGVSWSEDKSFIYNIKIKIEEQAVDEEGNPILGEFVVKKSFNDSWPSTYPALNDLIIDRQNILDFGNPYVTSPGNDEKITYRLTNSALPAPIRITVKVIPENAFGANNEEEQPTATNTTQGEAGVPMFLSCTRYNDIHPRIRWSPPFDDNSAIIVKYIVYGVSSSGTEVKLIEVPDIVRDVIHILNNEEPFPQYSISTINEAGEEGPRAYVSYQGEGI